MILADEPTGNLDSKTGQEILDLMDRLNQGGKTIVLVTHDPKTAARARRVVHMMDGVIDRIVVNDRRNVAPARSDDHGARRGSGRRAIPFGAAPCAHCARCRLG